MLAVVTGGETQRSSAPSSEQCHGYTGGRCRGDRRRGHRLLLLEGLVEGNPRGDWGDGGMDTPTRGGVVCSGVLEREKVRV